jgi:hypothetical protein
MHLDVYTMSDTLKQCISLKENNVFENFKISYNLKWRKQFLYVCIESEQMYKTFVKLYVVAWNVCKVIRCVTTSTTGNVFFVEGLKLYREPNLGHSAKTLFAEGQPQKPSAKTDSRQRQALGKENLSKLDPLGHGGWDPLGFNESRSLGPR